MYKTALELATQRLERMEEARTGGLKQELRPEEKASRCRGETLLHEFRSMPLLNLAGRLERASKQSSSSLYYNNHYFSEPIKVPLKLLRGDIMGRPLATSQIMIDSLVLSTIIFNVALHYHDKFFSDPDDTNQLSEASNLYHEVYVLAHNLTSTSHGFSPSHQSCQILALAHFLKLVALNNLSSLSLCAPKHTTFLFDSSDLLLQHVASKDYMSLKWAQFPFIQQKTTTLVLNAILVRSRRALVKKRAEHDEANSIDDGESQSELSSSCCPATSMVKRWAEQHEEANSIYDRESNSGESRSELGSSCCPTTAWAKTA